MLSQPITGDNMYIYGEKISDTKVKWERLVFDESTEELGDGWQTDKAEPDTLPWETAYYDPQNDEWFTEKTREPESDDADNFSVTSDKSEITADGTDTATITGTIEPTALGDEIDTVYMRIENSTERESSFINGEVVFEFATEVTGKYQIELDADGLATGRVYVEAV